MELTDILQGGGLVLGGAAVAKIIDAVVRIYGNRHQRTEVTPQPLEVCASKQYRTLDECRVIEERNRSDHENIFFRISALEKSMAENSAMLDQIWKTLTRIDERMYNDQQYRRTP